MVDCLSRFSVCSLLPNTSALATNGALLGDWIRFLDRPRGIIADNGPPVTAGVEWGELSQNYCINLVRAPMGKPPQADISGRVIRPIIAAQTTSLGPDSRPSKTVLTQVTMARNRAPHTVARIPPALAMAGRSYIRAWRAETEWSHDPLSSDPSARQANAVRNILNARNAIIASDSDRALVACASRNLPDRSREFHLVGSSVQIALRGAWSGQFRIIGRSRSNLILERGRQASEWRKYKVRRNSEQSHGRMGGALRPESETSEGRNGEIWRIERYAGRYPSRREENRPASSRERDVPHDVSGD